MQLPSELNMLMSYSAFTKKSKPAGKQLSSSGIVKGEQSWMCVLSLGLCVWWKEWWEYWNANCVKTEKLGDILSSPVNVLNIQSSRCQCLKMGMWDKKAEWKVSKILQSHVRRQNVTDIQKRTGWTSYIRYTFEKLMNSRHCHFGVGPNSGMHNRYLGVNLNTNVVCH